MFNTKLPASRRFPGWSSSPRSVSGWSRKRCTAWVHPHAGIAVLVGAALVLGVAAVRAVGARLERHAHGSRKACARRGQTR